MNVIIDDIAKNPDGLLARFTDALLMKAESASVPTQVPSASTKVFIGPTNYAGQGFAWARAIEKYSDIGAKNLEIVLPGGFAFEADSRVTVSQYNRSKKWQQEQLNAISDFTHVLVEAERPVFGSFFKRDLVLEIDKLRLLGLRIALMCHGTDVRSPRNHKELTEWSPYVDEIELSRQHQKEVDYNLRLIDELKLPTFVSTPDLLLDVPFATWCPVVVDVEKWSQGPEVLKRKIPVVVHIPSMGVIKGTHLIENQLRDLDREGIIEYRPYSAVPASEMPHLIRDADIVLDQFRIGSYGVAAVEAMSTGRIVIGHIAPKVRDIVKNATGFELPIIEATPDSLRQVLTDISMHRQKYVLIAEEGVAFAQKVHNGRFSVDQLQEHWLSNDKEAYTDE